MCIRIDVALSREQVLKAIEKRSAAGMPITLDDIANDIGCHRNTVWNSIQDLQSAGRLKVLKRGTRYVASEYEIVDGGRDAPTGGE